MLTPVRVADTFARPSIDDALEYVTRFVFRTNTDVPMGIDAEAFQNAGLRSALHYFTNYTIDKRKCHVHPRLVDYSRTRNHPVSKNQMTSEMSDYCLIDAKAAILILSAAKEMMGADESDFIQRVLVAPEEDEMPDPFLHDALSERFAYIKSNGLSADMRLIHNRVRENHERKILEESRRKQEAHRWYIEKRDEW